MGDSAGVRNAAISLQASLRELLLDIPQWSDARKTLLLGLAAFAGHLVVLVQFSAMRAELDAVVNMRLFYFWWTCWTGMCVAVLVVSWQHLRRDSDSSLPRWLMIFGYGFGIMVNAQLYGGIVGMYSGFPLLGSAVILTLYDIRSGLIAVVYMFIMWLAFLALTRIELLPFAPILIDRSIDAQIGAAYSAIGIGFQFIMLTVVFLCFILVYAGLRHAREQLEESGRLIGRYLPAAVAQHISRGDAAAVETPERRRITVLFADIAGFTELADRVEPELVTQIVNDYMAAAASAVEAHGGTLNEFSGDGVMALFGAPHTMEPAAQVRGAVAAARSFQQQLDTLNAEWLRLGSGTPLLARVGINTGMASVGSFGSHGRLTYTAIGLQTNIAARIETQCEPGRICLSDASWQLVQDELACTSAGEIAVKGVHFPIRVHLVDEAKTAAG